MNKNIVGAAIVLVVILGAIYYKQNAPTQNVAGLQETDMGTTTPVQSTDIPPTDHGTPAATSTNAAEARTVTQADNGKTVHVKQGSRIVVSLGEDVWTLTMTPMNIINRIKNIMVMRGSQGVYTADNVGTTVLAGEGRPNCDGKEMCAQYIIAFKTTIVVEK